MSNNETISITYDVVNGDNEIVRTSRISGSFDSDMEYIDMVDELMDRAYEVQMGRGGWNSSYSIVEA
tara:strand:- start:66787 stop:66987 length:201 start_codon:yes stop_codon:yes gene_type:complete